MGCTLLDLNLLPVLTKGAPGLFYQLVHVGGKGWLFKGISCQSSKENGIRLLIECIHDVYWTEICYAYLVKFYHALIVISEAHRLVIDL